MKYMMNKENLYKDFISSPNSVITKKNFFIKEFFKVNETETFINQGLKGRLSVFKSGDGSVKKVANNDFLIGVTDTTISRTVQLPKPSLAGIGKLYIISDLSGSALSTTISITPYSTELINGDTSTAINTNYGTIRLTTDGTNWFIIN